MSLRICAAEAKIIVSRIRQSMTESPDGKVSPATIKTVKWRAENDAMIHSIYDRSFEAGDGPAVAKKVSN